MHFQQTKTFVNLARSFAGESQAGMRYQLIAKQATAEEYPVLADIVRTIAKNETNHAKSFFDMLIQKAGSCDNIPLDAGYPFRFGTLEQNFGFAAEDERAEHAEVYPAFAADARAARARDRVPLSAAVAQRGRAVQARQADALDLRRVRLPRGDARGVEGVPFVQGKTGLCRVPLTFRSILRRKEMRKIPETMKALVAYGKGNYKLEYNYPTPVCGPGDIIIKTEACGICAGDLKCMHGAAMFWGDENQPPWVRPPFIPGHEFLGRVVETGERVTEFKVGDRITADQIVPCGKCRK